jgi:hypothetical protein
MRFLILASLMLAPAYARADGARATDVNKMASDDCAKARKQSRPCVITMDKAEDITGTSPTAGGSAIGILDYGKAASLVRIRRDFIVEMLKTAEDID